MFADLQHRMNWRADALLLAFVACALLHPPSAHADLQIGDNGPVLRAGRFFMRVSNAGIVGNPFDNISTDPSFEYPRGSGIELLHAASLWVGGVLEDGQERVSGGPLLEWRPTIAPEDTVREYWFGRLGSRWGDDDDGDGRLDEETPNGLDDDGDGEVDEDLGLSATQTLTAEYRDDHPAAVNYMYPEGEPHVPMGLSVHQEAYAWSNPGFDQTVGLRFVVRNHGPRTLRDVCLGLWVDLDVRRRGDNAGHLDDRSIPGARYAFAVARRPVEIATPVDTFVFLCVRAASFTGPFVAAEDGADDSSPRVGAVGLDHTTDPLAFIGDDSIARAPGIPAFRNSVFSYTLQRGSGGPPLFDAERYRAMRGMYPSARDDAAGDVAGLIACGPFAELRPGEALTFDAALGAAPSLDSLRRVLGRAAYLQHGMTFNFLPDSVPPDRIPLYTVGETGVAGHEVCLEPPWGHTFMHDPHCPEKFALSRPDAPITPMPVLYMPGRCIWTDADCDPCTGSFGEETVVRWMDPGSAPPPPTFIAETGDHEIRILWDNVPEILVRADRLTRGDSRRFLGYRLWKLTSWRGRASLLPPDEDWALLTAYACDDCPTRYGEIPLATIRDTTIAPVWTLFEQPQYPPGRYVHVDREVKNGFDYIYGVTSIYELRTRGPTGALSTAVLESPLVPTFDQRVTPRAEARDRAGGVWVVPNPFRARAEWDRPAVPGDPFTRHLDFMGLPRARCIIRIYTLAGDLVQELHHDASGGHGQASWDLISRNGQDVVSGIYLFTVDSELGRQVGRFVVIR